MRQGAITAPFALAFVDRCLKNNIPIGDALAFKIVSDLQPQHGQRDELGRKRQQLYKRIFDRQAKRPTTTTTTKQQKTTTFNVNIIVNQSQPTATTTTTTETTTTTTTSPEAKLAKVDLNLFLFLFLLCVPLFFVVFF